MNSSLNSNWSSGSDTPDLSQKQWNVLAVPAIVLVVVAILQIISFGKFKDWLDEIRVGGPTATAIIVIILELYGALSLLKVPLNRAFRFFGVAAAVIVTGFWFIENLMLASGGAAGQLPNSGYFGGYLQQTPGWWTVLEISIMAFWVLYSAELLKDRPVTRSAAKA